MRLCEHCGKPLSPATHGLCKYHRECARIVNLAKGTAKQSAKWAAKRAEKEKLKKVEEKKPKVCWNCGKPSEVPVCDKCKALFKAKNKARQLESNKKPKPIMAEPKPIGADDIPKGGENINPYPVGGMSGLPAYQGV